MARVKSIEVWAETASGGLNLYVLRELDTGVFEVLDPHNGNRLVERFTSFDDAEVWLTDDEYVPVDGRIEMDAPDLRGPDADTLRAES